MAEMGGGSKRPEKDYMKEIWMGRASSPAHV